MVCRRGTEEPLDSIKIGVSKGLEHPLCKSQVAVLPLRPRPPGLRCTGPPPFVVDKLPPQVIPHLVKSQQNVLGAIQPDTLFRRYPETEAPSPRTVIRNMAIRVGLEPVRRVPRLGRIEGVAVDEPEFHCDLFDETCPARHFNRAFDHCL